MTVYDSTMSVAGVQECEQVVCSGLRLLPRIRVPLQVEWGRYYSKITWLLAGNFLAGLGAEGPLNFCGSHP